MTDAARDARIWLVHVMEIADHEVPDALESAGLHIRHLLAECERQRKELGLAKGELREKKSVITYFTLLTRELEAKCERLRGEWEKEEYRCPQCGTGNPRIPELEAKCERLEARADLYEKLHAIDDDLSGQMEHIETTLKQLEAQKLALVVLCRVLIRDGEWHPYQLNHDVPEWQALGAELREAIGG